MRTKRHNWSCYTRLLYCRKIEMYIALFSLTSEEAMKDMDLHRDTFCQLKKRFINSDKEKKIEYFFSLYEKV